MSELRPAFLRATRVRKSGTMKGPPFEKPKTKVSGFSRVAGQEATLSCFRLEQLFLSTQNSHLC